MQGQALNKTIGIFSSQALLTAPCASVKHSQWRVCVCILFATSSLISLCPTVKTCSFYTNKVLSSSHERSQINGKYLYWFILLGPISIITSMEGNTPVQMFLKKKCIKKMIAFKEHQNGWFECVKGEWHGVVGNTHALKLFCIIP